MTPLHALHLLYLDDRAEVKPGGQAEHRWPFLGPLFEGFVAAEIVKHQLNAGRRREVYYFRDRQGLEIDLVIPMGSGALALVEAKASRTVTPGLAAPLARLRKAVGRVGPAASRETTERQEASQQEACTPSRRLGPVQE